MRINACGTPLHSEMVLRALQPEAFELHFSVEPSIHVLEEFPDTLLVENKLVPRDELWLVRGQEFLGKVVGLPNF